MHSSILLLAGSALAVKKEVNIKFENTPLTTECWQHVSSKNNEKLEMLMYEHPNVAKARSEDHRGAAWWAWEFGNKFALGAIKAHGGDIESTDEDQEGNKPKDMCTKDKEECDKMVEEAALLALEIGKRKEARDAAMQAELDKDDDEDEDKDDDADDEEDEKAGDTKITINKGSSDSPSGPGRRSKKEKDNGELNIEIDEDDVDDEDL